MRAPSGITRAMRFFGGAARPPVAEKPTAAQVERVRKALEAFVEAFKSRKLHEFEVARMELMKALADALVIATAVPLLQTFLRSAAVEIIAAVKSGTAAPFDEHAAALQAALDEARGPLGVAKKAGAFWEASI
jgi:DNA-binding GntR family transcriptional regulator